DRHLDVDRVDGLFPIVKAYAGMTGELFDALADSLIDGLVIEALGAGNLPPQTIEPLKKLIARNIPVVLVSRCFNGVAEPVYDYLGGGIELQAL
ncbi:asparaginase, partial [Enterococcus faecalis]